MTAQPKFNFNIQIVVISDVGTQQHHSEDLVSHIVLVFNELCTKCVPRGRASCVWVNKMRTSQREINDYQIFHAFGLPLRSSTLSFRM